MACDREAALGLYATAATHPIVRHVETVDEIGEAFDTITYQKGEAVIAMMEATLGPDRFRDGIRRYMARYKYGNTVSDQLWGELAAVAPDVPVRDIARDFTLQPGVPLVTLTGARCEAGVTTATLTQTRFGLDQTSKAPLTWRVPLRIGRLGVSGGADAVPVTAVVRGPAPTPVRSPGGGPGGRRSPGWHAWGGVRGDNRRSVAPSFDASVAQGDNGRSASWNVNPGVDLRLAERLQGNVGVAFGVNRNDWQWVGNYYGGTDTAAYTFGHLDQRTASLTARADYTFTPWVSLQAYVQPFLTGGGFADWRALADPGAADYAARWRPFADSAGATPTGFNYKQYRSNLVLRWEYRPGSTLFAVWQQARTQSDRDLGSFRATRDARNLFRTWPDNTLLLKLSYWYNP